MTKAHTAARSGLYYICEAWARAQSAQLKTYYPGNWGDLHRLDGMLALAHGDILQARIKVGHALTIATTLTDVPRTIQALDSSVLVLAQPNTAPTAAALLGLEQRLRKHYAMPVPPSWQPQLAAVEAQLTMWLSPDQIDH